MSTEKPAAAPQLPTENTIKELAKLGREAAAVTFDEIKAPVGLEGVPPSVPVAVRHGPAPTFESVAALFEPYRSRPERKVGTAKALTLESFIELTNRHRTEHSVIFADTDWHKPGFTAVIDYHEIGWDGDPAFGKHRIGYAFPLSEEWKAWIALDGKPMTQSDFAIFLEDRIADLSSPTEAEKNTLERDFGTLMATPSELIRLSRGLQVNVDARVKRAINLQTGESEIAFEETHKDADGKPIKVPGLFMLAISPFFMGEKVRIPVRLRYRVQGEKIVWFFQIYRPDKYVTERVRDDLATAAQQTGLPAFEGAPEMSAS